MTRIALALLSTLLACSERVEPPVPSPAPAPAAAKPSASSAPIRTDRTTYVVRDDAGGPEATIVATFRAPADQAVYILNCNGASGLTLQRKVGDEWVYAWVVGMAACLSPPIVVPPGGEHTGRLALNTSGGALIDGEPRLQSGTYRTVWSGLLTSFDGNKEGYGPELPLEKRVSAPFTIRVEPRRP